MREHLALLVGDVVADLTHERRELNVPNEPLPRMAAGPAASLLDRMRDLATGRGTEG